MSSGSNTTAAAILRRRRFRRRRAPQRRRRRAAVRCPSTARVRMIRSPRSQSRSTSYSVTPSRRWPARLRFRHLDHVGSLRLPRAGDRQPKCPRPDLGYRVPVTGHEVRREALDYPACRVFQPRRRTTEFVEPRERGVEVCLVEKLAAAESSPSTVSRQINRHSASKPCCEVPVETWVTTAPDRSFDERSRCRPALSGAMSHPERMYAGRSPGSNDAPRRWSIVTQSGAAEGSSRRLNAALFRAITDHVCEWAAASPARYRASSSSKAASISSRSNTTSASIGCRR